MENGTPRQNNQAKQFQNKWRTALPGKNIQANQVRMGGTHSQAVQPGKNKTRHKPAAQRFRGFNKCSFQSAGQETGTGKR